MLQGKNASAGPQVPEDDVGRKANDSGVTSGRFLVFSLGDF